MAGVCLSLGVALRLGADAYADRGRPVVHEVGVEQAD
jgi:hypothetical protein